MPVEAMEGDEWHGRWGRIAATPHSVEVVSFVFGRNGQEIHSYPYRTLSRWAWKAGPPETLDILGGRERITICGRGLQRLAEALEHGQLRVAREQPGGPLESGMCILQIGIVALE
jgi:hypothetical protein